jgi:hypothetical protein
MSSSRSRRQRATISAPQKSQPDLLQQWARERGPNSLTIIVRDLLGFLVQGPGSGDYAHFESLGLAPTQLLSGLIDWLSRIRGLSPADSALCLACDHGFVEAPPAGVAVIMAYRLEGPWQRELMVFVGICAACLAKHTDVQLNQIICDTMGMRNAQPGGFRTLSDRVQ